MRKIIAAINMTLDGVCDHRAGLADAELHRHYTDLLNSADTILYGRITYELMQYWQTLLKNPSGEKSADDFALAIDNIHKIVFSHQLSHTNWHTATLAAKPPAEIVAELAKQPGRDILIGSRSLIIQLLKLDLITECQLCLQPVVAGSGMKLFENLSDRKLFQLHKTKTFSNGSVILYYQTVATNTSK